MTLIEFLIKNGSERVIEASRDKMNKIRGLQDYNFYEGTADKGSGVREKSKQVVDLLNSNETIRSEREKAKTLRNKFVGISNDRGASYGNEDSYGGRNESYGGSKGFGSDNSYGGNKDKDNYGNKDKDSYGNKDKDSYGNKDSYAGRGNDSYGGNKGGEGRYSDSYNDSSSYGGNKHENEKDRYGGGAYDSKRPNRYSDDAPERIESFENLRDETDESKIKSSFGKSHNKPTGVPVEKSSTTGGKLKVAIKKANTTTTTISSNHKVHEEIDLFGDESVSPLASHVNTKPTATIDLFDPFSTPAPPVQQQQQQQFQAFPSTQHDFGDFTSAHVVPQQQTLNAFSSQQQQAAFDPFASTPAFQSAPIAPQQSFNAFPPQQPTFNAFPPQQQAYQPQQSFPTQQQFQPQQTFTQYQQPVQQQQQYQSNYTQQPVVNNNNADFGDFTSAGSSTTRTAAPADKWGDLGKLVDLGSIAKNEDQNKKPNGQSASSAAAVHAYTQSSFAGLDGFSKTPQSLVSQF